MMPFPEEYEPRIREIVSSMTLKEKVGQLNQYALFEEHTGPDGKKGQVPKRMEMVARGEVGSVLNLVGTEKIREVQRLAVEKTRLGIPLIFAYDVIHGYQTMFPIPLGEASSWNLDLIEKSAHVAAREATAAGLNWTFAPMVDVCRDPRWGRIMEGAGEDPFLGSRIAEARIRGFQGSSLSRDDTMAACAKHYAGYGFAESGMDYNVTDFSENTLHNVVLPPFKAASEAACATVMNGFNALGGVPVTIHAKLQREILKERWNFRGPIVSDWNSVGELIAHGVASNKNQAAKLALEAGCDIDMEASAYLQHLENLVLSGDVDERRVDDAVHRMLRLKFALGLFDDPYRYCDPVREYHALGHEDHLNTALEVARESIVLLKNDKQLLPLDVKHKIALIGPLADDQDSPLGNWRARAVPHSAVSVKDALEKRYGAQLSFCRGCTLTESNFDFATDFEIEQSDRSQFEEAAQIAKSSDVVIMVLGEVANMSGEGRSRSHIGLPGLQLDLLKCVHAHNPNIVLVIMSGRPLTMEWEGTNIPALLLAWHAGSQSGTAIADVLSGKCNPSGKLPVTIPRDVGQIPIYYNHLNTGRPTAAPGLVFFTHHNDIDRSPLYPFGFGLSYTKFSYSKLSITNNPAVDRYVDVSVTVTNVGEIGGHEIVQVYLRDLVATTARPIKELKAFEKIYLTPGQSAPLNFRLTASDLGFYGADGQFLLESGSFKIFVGGNSRDLLEMQFEI